MWSICTMDYHSATKKKEGLIHTTMWMNLENIILNGSGKTQRIKSCLVPLISEISRTGKSRDRTQIGGCQGLGGGDERNCLTGVGVILG